MEPVLLADPVRSAVAAALVVARSLGVAVLEVLAVLFGVAPVRDAVVEFRSPQPAPIRAVAMSAASSVVLFCAFIVSPFLA
jgi:hypothetical protein